VRGRSSSNFRPLGEFQCILYINAQIPDRVLDLGVSKQYLDCSKVAGGLIDYRSLRAPKRMRSLILPTKPNRRYPLINQPRVLPSA
jgi:hypothetical protein